MDNIAAIVAQLTAFSIALVGYYFNGIKNLRRIGYYLWIISNMLWGIITTIQGNYILTLMFLIYTIFCIVNIKKSFKKNKYE